MIPFVTYAFFCIATASLDVWFAYCFFTSESVFYAVVSFFGVLLMTLDTKTWFCAAKTEWRFLKGIQAIEARYRNREDK